MADLISRTLRDGGVPGEHAPALTIKDSITVPFGPDVFDHLLKQLASDIAAGKTKSMKGIVLVAFSKSPRYYLELLKRFEKWVCVVDCYSDPLGWNKLIAEKKGGSFDEGLDGVRVVVRDVRDLGKLLELILECGGGLVGVGEDGKKERFLVAVDSISEVLRHHGDESNVSYVASFLSKLRSDKNVASMFWVFRSDLCESRSVSVLEYLSTMVGSLELGKKGVDGGRRADMVEMGSRRGRFCVRFKKWNGRVKIVTERFQVEKPGVVKFMSGVGAEDGGVSSSGGQDVLGKLQFNLQLSEKEKEDRSQVVLPFEHQEHGKANQIYDGRRSQLEGKEGEGLVDKNGANGEGAGKGEIIYFRDSDDEMLDSDEDPDDDLDI